MRWVESIDWPQILSRENGIAALRVALIVVFGLAFFRVLGALLAGLLKKRFSDQATMIASKAVSYTGWIAVLFLVLSELGYDLTVLLGAAGIAGIAIGFASQTSVSNVISGLFLLSEKPFAVGDTISVGDITGVVMGIDLLSVKLCTFDNRYVRIPNESIIKTQVTNLTRFPIRRMDLSIGVAYREDVARVEQILRDVARRNPNVLDEPEPFFMFKSFGESALEIVFGVWFVKTEYVTVWNSMMRQIKERFDAEGVEIPFPQRAITVGAATDPFPVRIVEAAPADGPG
jgi:small-conductance mechanosensitive channel